MLIVGGIGAGLAGFAPRLSPGRCAAAFLAIGLVFAAIFASGKFGADVGAAIDFPVGRRLPPRWRSPAGAGAGSRSWSSSPLVVLGLLALADLVTGANSHFTRSVLDAGGLHSLGDVAQRRLQLSAHSFGRPVLLVAPAGDRGAGRRSPGSAPRPARRLGARRAGDAGRPDRRPRWPPSSPPSPTIRAPCCSRSAPPTCSSSSPGPGPREVDRRAPRNPQAENG